MEQGLEIQGVTAIEDKLQDGVPDALSCLRKAGTKVNERANVDRSVRPSGHDDAHRGGSFSIFPTNAARSSDKRVSEVLFIVYGTYSLGEGDGHV